MRMEPSSNGHPACRSLAGFYAVVSYLPEPLGGFLNDLRAELVPGCRLQSHITVLPPRRLAACPDRLIAELSKAVADAGAFEITLGDVQLFDSTRVAYLGLASGRTDVERLYNSLRSGAFAFDDYFPFHPHLTIAQEIPAGDVDSLLQRARRRWRECPHSRTFTLQNLTLVRNLDPETWEDLSEHSLQPSILLRTA